MLRPDFITAQFAIGPQIEATDFALLSEAGFRSVINARPDTEPGDYMKAEAAAGHAGAAGLTYVHSPTESHAIFDTDAIDRFERAMIELPGPIFAHCKSGTRTAILWALVAVRHQPTEDVIQQLNSAGQELTFLEDELRAERDNANRSPLRLKDEGLLSLGRSPLLLGTPEAKT
ncbi:MAG: TIGR01244 family phosphatase [Alphaproteobacteria bacterium]|nr:TIGR01244 family phosphatase [Alphaproteobacteria bacterium]